MKINLKQPIKIGLILLVSTATNSKIIAQEINKNRDNRVYSSLDLTVYGWQGRLAYDFYTKKGNCLGISVAQVSGLKQSAEEGTIYYNLQDIRLNLSVRYTSYLYQRKRISFFGTFQAGISYNTVLTGEELILPSFRTGLGMDFILIKGSGLRIEAGPGAPYAASIGYFFSM